LIHIGPDNLFQYLYDLSQSVRKSPQGWWILALVMIICSLPPLVGFTTFVSVCGFAWGIKGFLLAGPATFVGAAFSFLLLRFIFKARLKRLSETNDRWRALEEVVEAKGLPLIILIRFSPVPPWVYSNALFASIKSVAFWQFMVATIFIQPKVLLSVFVASRIAELADRDQRGKMDTPTKAINIASIVLGIVVGLGTGWAVYNLVQEKIKHATGLPQHRDDTTGSILEGVDQGAPLLRDFSPPTSDEEDQPQPPQPPPPRADARLQGRRSPRR